MFLKVPGGDWGQTQTKLEEVYGRAKRTFCWRMVVLAQTIPHVVQEKILSVEIPNSFIYNNHYFIGHGAQKDKRQ